MNFIESEDYMLVADPNGRYTINYRRGNARKLFAAEIAKIPLPTDDGRRDLWVKCLAESPDFSA